ncbi:MAG: cysteine--tRNA ligase, partial [Candidatus Helarchaeota archaeon]|nr:cysteine--tRNA ligase [Candidatus Helarchaeota archaeon]
QEGITIFELADRFIKQYFKDFDPLNVKRASFYPRATDHISDMIRIIERLLGSGFAYELDGNVYFSIETFSKYGVLSHKDLNEIPPTEEEKSVQKKNPKDFVLWKKRKEDEPCWNSPWGLGRPGWHIECSAMSMKYLGETLDIHGGGLDLVFPHHENEIAQSEALTNKPFVRYFVHNGFVTVANGEKMSKSLGNFFTIEDILQKYPPMALRFFLLSTHYRSPITFSEEQIVQAKLTFSKIQLALAYTRQREVSPEPSVKLSDELDEVIEITKKEFLEAMDDDFSTPKAVASINALARHLNRLASLKEGIRSESLTKAHDTLLELCYVLGLVERPELSAEEILIDRLMALIMEMRNEARKSKQYIISDKIRVQLKTLGISFLDYPNWTLWIKE